MSAQTKGPCEHANFEANVAVTRLTDGKTPATVTGYTSDIRVRCADCGVKFQWIGLPPGMSPSHPCSSLDGLEARMPICPEGSRPSHLSTISMTLAGGDPSIPFN